MPTDGQKREPAAVIKLSSWVIFFFFLIEGIHRSEMFVRRWLAYIVFRRQMIDFGSLYGAVSNDPYLLHD